MSEFKPGLEGVVAVETEIAEPDRDGGALRYRGVDIEELVGHVPYENVWGLLVDDDPASTCPAGALRARAPDGRRPADLQAETCPPRGRVGPRQAQRDLRRAGAEDLGRLSAQMMSIVARPPGSPTATPDAVPDEVVARAGRGGEVPAPVARRGRPAAREGDRHVLDLHRRARPERVDVHRARRRLDRRRLRRRAVVGGRRALPGPLHGGAPARVKPMLEEVAAMGDAEAGSATLLERRADHGLRPPRLPRRGSALAPPEADREGARLEHIEVAEELERVALAALQERSPDRVLATNVEYYSAVVLDVAEIPPPLAPAMFACSRVAGWSAHILEQKRTGRLFRPSARYVGPAERSLSTV